MANAALPGPGETSAAPDATFTGRARQQLSRMAPANFAMVMGTGIVAVGLAGQGHPGLATLLCLLCVALWLIHVFLLGGRLLLFPAESLADLRQPARSSGYLTLVAGTNVLGSGCALIFHNNAAAHVLFWIGLCLWPCLACLIWVTLCITDTKAPLEKGINGAWLLFTVSTQSVVVLAALVWEDAAGAEAGFLLFTAFFLGESFYFLLMPLIIYRLMFKPLAASELSATFWINAGAMAITCLAGVRLSAVLQAAPETAGLVPLTRAMAAGAWGMASFWIPCLILLGVWRHLMRRYAFQYSVEYWSMVFPLGMYTVCTQALHALFPYPVLAHLSRVFMLAALAVWVIVFLSMCLFLWRHILVGHESPRLPFSS